MAGANMTTSSARATIANSSKNGTGNNPGPGDDPHGFSDALDQSGSDPDTKKNIAATARDGKTRAEGTASSDQTQANAASLAAPSPAEKWAGKDGINTSAQFLAQALNGVNEETVAVAVKPGDLESVSPRELAQQLVDGGVSAATGDGPRIR